MFATQLGERSLQLLHTDCTVRLCTCSSDLMFFWLTGSQAVLAYSTVGLTMEV